MGYESSSGTVSQAAILGQAYRTVGTSGQGAFYTVGAATSATTVNSALTDQNVNGGSGRPAFILYFLAATFIVDSNYLILNQNATIWGSGQRATVFQPAAGLKGPIFAWQLMGVPTQNFTNIELREFTMDFTNAPSPVAVTIPVSGSNYNHGTTGATPATTQCMVVLVPNGATITAVKYGALGGAVSTTGPAGPNVGSNGWANSNATLNQAPTNPQAFFMQLTDLLQVTYGPGTPLLYYYPMHGIELVRAQDNTAPIILSGIESINNTVGSTATGVATGIPWVGNVFAPIITMGVQEGNYSWINVSIGGFLVTLARGGSSRISDSTVAGWMHDGKSDVIKGVNFGNNGVYHANYSAAKSVVFEFGCHHDGPIDTTNSTPAGGPVFAYNYEKKLIASYFIFAGDVNAAGTLQADGVHAPTQGGFVGGENPSQFNAISFGCVFGIGGLTAPIPFFLNPATGLIMGWMRDTDQTAAQLLKNSTIFPGIVEAWFNPGTTNGAWTRVRGGEFKVPTALSSGSPYTVLKTDEVILVTTGAGGFTVNLPLSSQLAGRMLTVIKADAGAGTVTVQRTSGDTIEGATSVVLNAQNKKTRLYADGGTTWYDLTANFL